MRESAPRAGGGRIICAPWPRGAARCSRWQKEPSFHARKAHHEQVVEKFLASLGLVAQIFQRQNLATGASGKAADRTMSRWWKNSSRPLTSWRGQMTTAPHAIAYLSRPLCAEPCETVSWSLVWQLISGVWRRSPSHISAAAVGPALSANACSSACFQPTLCCV